MTPAEHLAEAERLLGLYNPNNPGEAPWQTSANLASAQTHALIAVGAQLGVPHQHLPAGGGETGAAPG